MGRHQLFWNQNKGRVFAKEVEDHPSNAPTSPSSVRGSCHCKKVTFIATIPPAELKAVDCSCSVCAMKGYLHLIVPKNRVVVSEESLKCLTTYSFNTGVAKHTFCTGCGVQPFYTPRSNPDCYDLNVRCLQLGDLDVPIEELDGQNFTGSLHAV